MTAAQTNPGTATVAALKARFGSVAAWVEDFQAAGKAAAGWAVLAFHPLNRKLYDIVTDSHDDGPAWLGVPLVVVDTYEHSYYLDYQNRKGDYLDRFCRHIDWAVVEQRLRACLA
jgi:Fe-Mn family superoxide dismutase